MDDQLDYDYLYKCELGCLATSCFVKKIFLWLPAASVDMNSTKAKVAVYTLYLVLPYPLGFPDFLAIC